MAWALAREESYPPVSTRGWQQDIPGYLRAGDWVHETASCPGSMEVGVCGDPEGRMVVTDTSNYCEKLPTLGHSLSLNTSTRPPSTGQWRELFQRPQSGVFAFQYEYECSRKAGQTMFCILK